LISHPGVLVNGGAGVLGSPLHIAVVYQKFEIIKKLLEKGADPNFTD
jgi:ankyrin repeat protein